MKKKTTKKKTPASKANPLVELLKRKNEVQKSGGTTGTFGKFQKDKPRNENNSNVGPSWGPRKGN